MNSPASASSAVVFQSIGINFLECALDHLSCHPRDLRHCEDSVLLKPSSTCTNEPTDEDLCAGHVSYGNCDRIVLDTTRQILALSVVACVEVTKLAHAALQLPRLETARIAAEIQNCLYAGSGPRQSHQDTEGYRKTRKALKGLHSTWLSTRGTQRERCDTNNEQESRAHHRQT